VIGEWQSKLFPINANQNVKVAILDGLVDQSLRTKWVKVWGNPFPSDYFQLEMISEDST
jgi:hypothetical protein